MAAKSRYSIILASTSPRRVDLMKQVGLSFKTQGPGTDEARKPGESPRRMVRRLAREKAVSVALGRQANRARVARLVIAADTIVVAPDGKTVLGKPSGAADARRMLTTLAGRKHSVLTGYCVLLVDPRVGILKKVTRVVKSRVRMRALDRREIDRYIRTGEPMDKAGSYAAQGIGMALIDSIQGSYTNVVGLPMCQLLLDLEKEFDVRLFPS